MSQSSRPFQLYAPVGMSHYSPSRPPSQPVMSHPNLRLQRPVGSIDAMPQLQYGMNAQGEKFPIALAPYLQNGLPIKMAKACEDKSVHFLAFKFPEGFDLPNLDPPIQIERDFSQMEIAEDVSSSTLVGGDNRPINLRGGQRHKTRRIDPSRCPWKVTDRNKKNLMGRKTGLDTSTYFVMVEKANCFELVPLDSWFTFNTEIHRVDGETETPSADLAERKRRAAMKMEERAIARLAVRVARSDSPDQSDEDLRPTKKLRRSEGDERDDSLYDEDGGLKRQQKKRIKSMLQQRKRKTKHDAENVEDSALNLGELKRHQVDWDWEDDGKASDDEDGDDQAKHEDDDMDETKNDFVDSDDDDREILTKFGQQVTSALESQKEQDADDELAQFSDDEEEEEEKGKEDASSSRPPSATKAVVSSKQGATAKSSSKQEEPLSADSVRQKVVRLLSLHGGSMATKQFISSFNITSNKSDLFQYVRRSINEVCEVHTETINDEQVKVLELLPQFRQT